jgi:hypothetical protein
MMMEFLELPFYITAYIVIGFIITDKNNKNKEKLFFFVLAIMLTFSKGCNFGMEFQKEISEEMFRIDPANEMQQEK